MIFIGYSGHAYVVYGILRAAGQAVTGYCDKEEKQANPFQLDFHGPELSENALSLLIKSGCFIAVGDNIIRNNIFNQISLRNIRVFNAIHPGSLIDHSAILANNGVMIAANVTINPLASIGVGAICNTACVIEHECIVGNFSHIGPGAVLCGNVKVGNGSFVGANAVIKQGVQIGNNVMIGAGTVVISDVADNALIIGNPGRGI